MNNDNDIIISVETANIIRMLVDIAFSLFAHRHDLGLERL
jgi:hypothetical protein